MLISPPFLPPKHAGQTEEAWLNSCMICGQPGDGAFPVSFQLGWHGGVHLSAPVTGELSERVRAIADGTVVFKRQSTSRQDDPQHPLNYRGWTDDGCVVIRHDTAIGEGSIDEAITFFSVYMHLSSVDTTIAAGRRISRKAELGEAGQIYGDTQRKIHFEIVCGDAALQHLVGRSSGDLNLSQSGRTDAVYGGIYFSLPVATAVFSQKPVPQLEAAHFQPPKPTAHAPLPALVALTAAFTTDAPLIVEMRYAEGRGDLENRGDLDVFTRIISGVVIGNPIREPNAEYSLVTTAETISKSFPQSAAHSPATVFELLRFGRTVNTEHETAITNTIPHWRQISYPGGVGWVNLNAAAVGKFSDADFPQWCGWSIVDDSADSDSRCDSAIIRGLLDTDSDGEITLAERTANLNKSDVKVRLSRAICKIPSDWDVTTIDTRWGWLKTQSAENPSPLSAMDFEELKAHITALGFNSGDLQTALWHWHPFEFIRHFRTCSWLSLTELSQLLPRRSGNNAQHLSTITWATATARFGRYCTHINTTMRKFGITSRHRQTHFLAQTYIETALWRTMEELGRAHQQRRPNGDLYWPAPAMQYYQAFYGRGAMQLTWAGNFDKYGSYRAFQSVEASHQYVDDRITRTSTHYWADPRNSQGIVVQPARAWWPRYDPNDIIEIPFYSCDSAGYYWASKNTGGGLVNINRTADQGLTSDAVGRASVLVNGGSYGFSERQAYAVFIDRYLSDGTETDNTRAFVVNYRGNNHHVYVDFTAQRQ